MTTWSDYIEFMQSKGNLQDIMIISAETGATWAATKDFNLKEYKAMIVQEVLYYYYFYFFLFFN